MPLWSGFVKKTSQNFCQTWKNGQRFFIFPPCAGSVQKQDFVNNQALTKRTLIFTLFRKTQKREWFQTKSGAKRSDFSISRVFLIHWQKCCKTLWTKEFYKIIARMIFSARLKIFTFSAILKRILSLKLRNFAVKWISENSFTFIQKNSEYTA